MKKITFLLFSFLAAAFSWQGYAQLGSDCSAPLVVSSVPFNDAGNTSAFGNNYSSSDVPPLAAGAVTNGTGASDYISGDDVVYSYTAGADGSINISTTNQNSWIGLWVFTGCPFSETVGYHTSTSGAARSIPNLPVVAGQTYYIVISTWPSPQSTEYTINIDGTAPYVYEACTGTPAGGTVVLSATSGNPGESYTVSAQGYTLASDMSFQWQSNLNGQGWQDEGVSSDTLIPYVATAPSEIGDTVEWRLVVTCNVSEESAYSEIATFTSSINYCTSAGSSVEPITRVIFAGIDNSSPTTTAGSGYEDFTSIVGEVEVDNTYSFTAEGNTSGPYTNYFTVWIDWNQNGTFETEEMYEIGSINNSSGEDGQQATSDIVVPSTALEGDTRMRVVKNYNTSRDNPCGSFSYGEVEDYTINVAASMSVDDNSLLSNIRLYPNPTNNGIFSIKAPKLHGESVLITVNDMLGREVYAAEKVFLGANLQVNLGQNLMNGVYIVSLKTKGELQSFRVVKR
ncbi:T9SS type A sorting domain-containing protein [Oceanihabitans sediminis]|uniref:GEVED domain-containing protein n=1 Tax=Oceanihabitans sediminis TaxID=1812012 RepID=UPI00093161DA|nr:T9SS type A sorting domain-containing protein [Oceanihabitans sediminis]MDX1278279.1 GEVED domain-containing protein [Oceanihabitans sediminis]